MAHAVLYAASANIKKGSLEKKRTNEGYKNRIPYTAIWPWGAMDRNGSYYGPVYNYSHQMETVGTAQHTTINLRFVMEVSYVCVSNFWAVISSIYSCHTCIQSFRTRKDFSPSLSYRIHNECTLIQHNTLCTLPRNRCDPLTSYSLCRTPS